MLANRTVALCAALTIVSAATGLAVPAQARTSAPFAFTPPAVSASRSASPSPPASPSPSASPTPSPSSTPATLEDIFVTAQRASTARTHTPRETYVITAADLTRFGAVTLGDALSSLPGLFVKEYGAPGHLETALLRGATSTETLVLVNGRPVNEAGVGLFDFSSLPVRAVSRIEIVEGAASALYGSAAMGGVINIITRGAGDSERGSFDAGIGSEGAYSSAAGASFGESAGDGARIDVARNHAANAYSYPAFGGTASGTLSNNDTSLSDAFVTLSRTLGVLQATAHLNDDASRDGEPGSVTFGASLLARQERYFLRSDVALELADTKNDAVAQCYSDGQRIHFYDGTSQPASFVFPFDSLTHIATKGCGLRDTLTAAHNALTVGYDSRGDRAEFEQTYAGVHSSAPGTAATTGWYASDEYDAGSTMTWTLGLREERPQGFAHTDVPSIGLLLRNSDGSSGVRANYGRAFRIPALEETSPFFFGNPSLQPEYAATFDAGVFRKGVSLTFFGSRAGNLIVSEPPNFVPENVSLAGVRGFNAYVELPARGAFHLTAAYTDYVSAKDLGNGNRLPFRPTATGSVRAWRQLGSLQYGASVTYVGKRYADDPNVTLLPQYATLGLFAARPLGAGTTLTIRFENLTGERVETVPGYPVPPATLWIGISRLWLK